MLNLSNEDIGMGIALVAFFLFMVACLWRWKDDAEEETDDNTCCDCDGDTHEYNRFDE